MKIFEATIVPKAAWNALPAALGRELAGNLLKEGYVLTNKGGFDVNVDGQLDDFMVGQLVRIWARAQRLAGAEE